MNHKLAADPYEPFLLTFKCNCTSGKTHFSPLQKKGLEGYICLE